MCFKTILVPTELHELMEATLETALLLARKFDSYIEGFALRVALPNPFVIADVASVLMPALEQESDEKAQRARRHFDDFMQKHGVSRKEPSTGLSAAWVGGTPQGDYFVGSHGRVFD